jgi:hypothetical protein
MLENWCIALIDLDEEVIITYWSWREDANFFVGAQLNFV